MWMNKGKPSSISPVSLKYIQKNGCGADTNICSYIENENKAPALLKLFSRFHDFLHLITTF